MLEFIFIHKLIVFLVSIIALILGGIVYFSSPNKKANRIFVLMVFLMLCWVNFAYFARTIGVEVEWVTLSSLFLRIAWSTTPLLTASLYFLVIYLFDKEKKHIILSSIVFLAGGGIALITGIGDLIIKDIQFFGGDLTIIYGKAMYPYLGIMFFLTCAVLYSLTSGYLKSSIEEKTKVQYFLIGTFIFFTGNIIFNMILPVFFNIVHFYYFGDYSTIFLLGFTAYAIVKRELFGIRVVLTTLLVSLIAILLSLDIFVFTTELISKLYKGLVLVVFLYFGYLLIMSVLKEIEMREKIKKAYDIEKKAREQIEELTEAKTQFIMATQHHLRTPLTSMIGFLDLLFGGTYGKVPVKIKQALLKFESSTKRLIRVVNELLDISQFQLGKEVVSLNPGTDVLPILKEVIEELQFEAEYRDIYLKLEKIEKIPKIKADSEKLKVGLFNIVDNAIKYTRKGGVTVTLQKVGANVRISVKDTGIGLDSEKAKTLFKSAFVRGKEAKEVHGFGRGIGVYITGHIIKAHHGKIWAESEGEGKGSTFFIELPVG